MQEVKQENYSQGRIDTIKRYLQREIDNKRPRDFVISVDGFNVVTRTSDLSQFDDYEIELRDDSTNVTITIFDGPSTPKNTKYSFSLQQQPQPLNGPGTLGEIEKIVQARLEEKDKDYKITELQRELEETQGSLAELEKYKDTLEAEILALKENKFNIRSVNMMEVGTMLVENLIKRNINPETLAGFLGGPPPNQVPPQAPSPEAEATFQKQGEAGPQLTESQVRILKNWNTLESQIKGQRLVLLNGILASFCKHPEQVEVVADLINIKINPNP